MIYFLASYLSYLRGNSTFIFFLQKTINKLRKTSNFFCITLHCILLFIRLANNYMCNISKYQVWWIMVRLVIRRRRFWNRFISLTYISGHSAGEEVCSQRSRTDHVTFLGRYNQMALQIN